MADDLVDWAKLRSFRAELGSGFTRILGYFQEDGAKSLAAIEQAFDTRNAAALIIPAHTLKGESLQFGAIPLGALAERIEMTARSCVEQHRPPHELADAVQALRPMFERTLVLLAREGAPPVPAAMPGRAVFGRRAAPVFGRAG